MPKQRVKLDHRQYRTVTFGGAKERARTSGRNVYESLTRTNLNRTPIGTLQAHILKGALLLPEDETPFMTPKELSEALLVDGSMVLLGDGVDFILLEDTIVFSKWLAIQVIKEKGDNSIVRVFSTVNGEGEDVAWKITTYSGFNLNKKFKKSNTEKLEKYINGLPEQNIMEEMIVPFETIYIWENGRGVIFWNQRMFFRLEDIDLSIGVQTKADNIKTIMSGFQGDTDQLHAEWARSGSLFAVPGDRVTTVQLANSGMVGELSKQFYNKKKDYYEAVRVIHFSDAFNMSGTARRVLLTHMIHHIDFIQKQMKDIYADFGFKIKFDVGVFLELQERLDEYEFLIKLFNNDDIDKAEFDIRVKKLI